MSKKARTKGRERQDVLRELIHTEKNFVNYLNTCRRLYEIPLGTFLTDSPPLFPEEPIDPFFTSEVKKKPIISKSDFDKIFCNLDVIRQINTKLLENLNEYVANGYEKSKESLGDIFQKFAPVLKDYTLYTNTYQQAILHLNDLLVNNSAFEEFTILVQTHPDSKYANLDSYLIQPIQRLPRYNLLLGEIIKHTSPYHKEYASLNEALKSIQSTTEYIDTTLGAFEKNLRLRDLGDLLTKAPKNRKHRVPDFPLLTPDRKLLLYIDDCRVSISNEYDIHFDQHASVYICNDMILFCRRNMITEDNIVTEYYDYVTIDCELVPWCFTLYSNGNERTNFMLVAEQLYVFEFTSEEALIASLKVLVDVLDGITKKKKGTTFKRPTIPFLNPSTVDRASARFSIRHIIKRRNASIVRSKRLYLEKPDFPEIQINDKLKEELSAVRAKSSSEAISIAYALRSVNPSKISELPPDHLHFRKGDVILLFGKTENGGWHIARKAGLNVDKNCLLTLQMERKPRVYDDFAKTMKNQRAQKKVNTQEETDNDKTLRRMAGNNFLLVDNGDWSDLTVNEKRICSYLTSTAPDRSSIRKSHRDIDLKFLKKGRSLEQLDVSTSLVNVYVENGQVGVVPTEFVAEFSIPDQILILETIGLRDADELKKTRNFQRPTDLKKEIVKEGWILKEGHVYKTVRERWFMIRSNGTIQYYKNLRELRGTIHLHKGTIQKEERKGPSDSPFTFSIHDTVIDKKTYLFVPTEAERNDWMTAIQKCIEVAKPPQAANGS